MNVISETNFKLPGLTGFYRGKVRDVYTIRDRWMIMVATDRISAFDVVLPRAIPYKGQVLTQIASRFLDLTADICPNWKTVTPDPMVMAGHRCEPFPVEMIIRGYLTGSSWRTYKSGARSICGVPIPEGMREHQRFAESIITPTTKAVEGHDEDISKEEIIRQGLVSDVGEKHVMPAVSPHHEHFPPASIRAVDAVDKQLCATLLGKERDPIVFQPCGILSGGGILNRFPAFEFPRLLTVFLQLVISAHRFPDCVVLRVNGNMMLGIDPETRDKLRTFLYGNFHKLACRAVPYAFHQKDRLETVGVVAVGACWHCDSVIRAVVRVVWRGVIIIIKTGVI